MKEYLLRFNNELNEEQKNHLNNQINSIDFNLLNDLLKIENKNETIIYDSVKSYETTDEYYNIGLEVMKKGKYAVVTMAGGQGTRLDYNGPKGTYKLEYGINKTLFEIQCDKLKEIYKISNYIIYLLIRYFKNFISLNEIIFLLVII